MHSECYLNDKLLRVTRIGIPLYFGEQNADWGGWMMDNASPSNTTSGDHESNRMTNSLWLAIEKDNKKLFEFENKARFKQQQISLTHDLTHAFDGDLLLSCSSL
jgi:hypothetical protein